MICYRPITRRVRELHTLRPCVGHMWWCFELVVHVDGVVIFNDGNKYYSPMKKEKRSTMMPRGKWRKDQCDAS